MKSTRLALKIITTLIKDRVHYPSKLIADTFTMIARCGILIALYTYVFNLQGGYINGSSFTVAAWSIFLYFCFSMLRLRDIPRMVMQDVQSGNVEVLFNKPISYLAYRAWWQVGSGIYPFAVSLVLGTILMLSFVGIAPAMTSAFFWVTLFAVTLGGIVLSVTLYLIVGVLAFWIEDVNPVFWIIDKAVMILGGSYLPVALFPLIMKKVALFSPFGATMFITHTVYDAWATEWITALSMQLVWIVILGLLLYILYESAKKKISVNGG